MLRTFGRFLQGAGNDRTEEVTGRLPRKICRWEGAGGVLLPSIVGKALLLSDGAVAMLSSEADVIHEPIGTSSAHFRKDCPAPRAVALEPGSHLVTPRRGYTHHGIYVGGGKVIQYGGLARGLRCAPIEEVSLEQFAGNHPVWLRRDGSMRFDANEIVQRARARLGENRYHVLTNNCEHFCEWCLRAEHRSEQVDKWRSFAGRLVRSAITFFGITAVTFPTGQQKTI